jgi:hypothetical protein
MYSYVCSKVVVSLSSYGTDFEGGLYVSTGAGRGQARYVPMQAGDAVSSDFICLLFKLFNVAIILINFYP